MAAESMWALLVGVNQYHDESIPKLSGCENDVQAMRDLFERIGMPPTHIRTLVNQQATYEQVKYAFREHFITNADLSANAQCVYYFSGHGSQIYDPDQRTGNGYQSTVLHDSRIGDTPDLLDLELGALIRELYETKRAYITVILDCCHAGSGTRNPQITPSQERTIRAAHQDAHVRRIVQSLGGRQEPAPHVLMAACLDRQSSVETLLPTPDGNQTQRGVFSYYLNTTFDQAYGRSYREWLDDTKIALQQFGYSQIPVCDGIHANRALFGTAYLAVPQSMPAKASMIRLF